MGITLVGKQMVNFTNPEGEKVEGVKLHMTVPDDRVSGLAAVTQFIRKDHGCYSSAVGLPLGEIIIEYGFRGSILAVKAVGK